MTLTRVVSVLALTGLSLAACRREPPPEPEPEVRVDTVIETREVEPPLPEGRPATVCLATGEAVQVYISPRGDTLVGPRRTALREMRGVAFAGDYADSESWFIRDESIMVDDRSYTKFGSPQSQDCDRIRVVDEVDGVNVFSEVGASAPYETVYVPVEPGVFQPYETGVGEVRG